MIIYGALLSPFVRKVALALEEKQIAHELHPARGRDGPSAEFLAISPFGKMPALRDGDFALADSSAIIHYLEASHPEPRLLPAEPRALGRAIWFDEYADTIFAASGLKIMFNRLVGPRFFGVAGDEAKAAEGEAELPRIRDYLESVVPAEGWLVGAFSLADISVAAMLKTMHYLNFGPAWRDYPKTRAWYARIEARPAWQRVAEAEARMAEKLGLTAPVAA